MARAKSPTEIVATNYDLIVWGEAWQRAFSRPESVGVWCIWGDSGNGKTSFSMQLAKELARTYKVIYLSREEGARLTMKEHILRHGLLEVKRNFNIVSESTEKLSERLKGKRSPQVAIIDSVDACGINVKEYRRLCDAHPNKLLIFVSRAEGNKLLTNAGKAAKFDADLKLFVQGFRAYSKGRFNEGNFFTIWDEKANEYWGISSQNTQAL